MAERTREEPAAKPGTVVIRRDRRALSHVGGAVTVEGDAAVGARLAEALDVPTSEEAEEAARAHVHGFHSYPARMHPLTARRLVEAFSAPGEGLLDPFCGSGTVVVEGRIAGRRVIGVDLNPLAARLTRLKARGTTQTERERMLEAARGVAAVAEARRKAKMGATHRYGQDDMALFEPHVLLELDGLRLGLDEIPHRVVREDLELVLSAILTKVSRKASDTSSHEAPRRIAAGYPSRLFVRKTEELIVRLAEVGGALAAAPPLVVMEADARTLHRVEPASIALVVTSPPYPGVYDYLAHHEARLRWLRLKEARLASAEIGARRHLDPLGPSEGVHRWRAELLATFSAIQRSLRPSGAAILLIADSVVAGSPAFADDLAHSIAPEAGLVVRAIASQARPHFHAPTARAFMHRPRREHAVFLVRPAERPVPIARRIVSRP